MVSRLSPDAPIRSATPTQANPAPIAPASSAPSTGVKPAGWSTVGAVSGVARGPAPIGTDAQAMLRTWLQRGDTARALAGAALENELGTAMLLQPNHPPKTASDAGQLSDRAFPFFTGKQLEAVNEVKASVLKLSGGQEPVRVAALPIVLTEAKSQKSLQVPLFRVDGKQGETLGFVDNLGRRYATLEQWKAENKLPAGQLTYPARGHLTARPDGLPYTVSEPSHAVIDTPLEQVEDWAEKIGTVAGFVVGGAALVGVGGVAVPLAGAALAIGFGGKAILGLVDAARHGETINPVKSSEARSNWLSALASVAGLGSTAAVGAAARELSSAGQVTSGLGKLAGRLSTAAQATGAAQLADGTVSLASHWKQLSWKERIYASAQMAFFAGTSAHGLLKDGAAPAVRERGGAFGSSTEAEATRYLNQLNETLGDGMVTHGEVDAMLSSAADGNFKEVNAYYLAAFAEHAKAKFEPGAHAKLSRFIASELEGVSTIEGDSGRSTPTGQPAITADSLSKQVVWGAKKGEVSVNGIGWDDVLQGNVGDCYYLSSLSAVAKADPALLEKAIRPNSDGSYTVTFHQRLPGEAQTTPVEVTVDAQFPTRKGQLEYAAARDPKELWPAIMEKAYAQWKGSYDGIEGGMAATALEALTGAKTDFFTVTSDLKGGEVFAKLRSAVEGKGAAVALSNPFGTGEQGLIDGHAYTVLDAAEREGTQMVQLRNPWGQVEWGQDGRDDGVFWLPVDVFTRTFSTVETAKL